MKAVLYPILVLLVGVAVASCATTPSSEPPKSPERAAAKTTAPAKTPSLPNQELDEQTLFDILVGELAGQRGDINVASASLGRAAERTRDPRLAERASLAAIYAKNYDDAHTYAELWVELEPNDVDAREAMASTLMELDRPVEAQLQFEKILSLEAARNSLDQAYFRIAGVLGRQSNRQAAIEIMQTLVNLHPRSPAAQFAMAHLAVRGGDLETANLAVDRALALRPDWDEAALFKARILVSRKDFVRAQAFYEDFLERYPKATNVRVNFARFLIDQKQWDKALVQFREVVAQSPDDVDALYAVGLLSLQTNQIDEARKYLQQVLAKRPDHDQARLYLGQAAEQEKHWDEAAKWYSGIEPGESYFEAQARLAVVVAKQGKTDEARERLHNIDTTTPQQRIQLILAEEQVLREARRYQEAFDVMNRALVAMPNDKDLMYARALVAEKVDRLDVVESDLRAILKQDPKNVHALNALGYTLADRTTRYNEAKDLLDQALALKPDDAFILDSVGWLYFRMGNNAEAIKYLKRALAIRSDAEIAAHLGEVLWVAGNRNEAETVWDRALRDTPDNEALLGVIRKFKP